MVKTTYQIRLGPIHDPRKARFRGPPHRPARDRVQNLQRQSINKLCGERTCFQKNRTSVKSILRWHAGVLLERRQRSDINRPFTELHRLALDTRLSDSSTLMRRGVGHTYLVRVSHNLVSIRRVHRRDEDAICKTSNLS